MLFNTVLHHYSGVRNITSNVSFRTPFISTSLWWGGIPLATPLFQIMDGQGGGPVDLPVDLTTKKGQSKKFAKRIKKGAKGGIFL